MSEIASHDEWRPRHSPWLIALGVMLATFMQVLDTSIANIALPHIAGSLSVTPDQATWVRTSYLVANAIILPMTGWLGNRFGRKRVLIWCIAMFTFASVLCGVALNLPMLILARILQGAGGGAMVPIAQAVLLESFPANKRGTAMAIFTQGVVVAPIIGPTLGGWITDNYSWRWVFYINVPVGILAIFLAEWLVEDPPYIKRNLKAAIDFIGFGLLALWLATLQIVLDKGQEADWFGAEWVRWFTVISAVSMVGFILREFTVKYPLVDLRILKNRNFAVGLFLITIVVAILYGTTVELPLFLQTLMGYPALQSGYALSPRGIGAHILVLELGLRVSDGRGRGETRRRVRPGSNGDARADFHGGFLIVGGADARALQDLGVVVGKEKIERGRTDGHCKVTGVEVGQRVKRWVCGGGAARRTGGAGAGRAATVGCRAVGLQGDADAAGPGDAQGPLPVFAHLQDGDVDDNFAARLVEVVNELLREQELVGRAAHDNGVLALHAVDLGVGHDVAQGSLHVVEVVLLPGIGQIKSLHRLLVEFLALGARVLRDKNGVAGDRAPEGIGHDADDAQCVEERNIV